MVFPMIFLLYMIVFIQPPNGLRYLPWGGAQIRCLNGTIHYEVYSHFSGANPHGQVNAVLGRLLTYQDLAN